MPRRKNFLRELWREIALRVPTIDITSLLVLGQFICRILTLSKGGTDAITIRRKAVVHGPGKLIIRKVAKRRAKRIGNK